MFYDEPMDELTACELNDVHSRWAQNGNPNGLSGLGAEASSPSWFQKTMYQITGDQTWFGLKPEMPASEREAAEAKAAQVRQNASQMIRTPGILPGPISGGEKSPVDKATEEAVVAQKQNDDPGQRALSMTSGPTRVNWDWVPWAIAGALGLMLISTMLRRR